jgi:hypothetical protein
LNSQRGLLNTLNKKSFKTHQRTGKKWKRYQNNNFSDKKIYVRTKHKKIKIMKGQSNITCKWKKLN